MISYHRDTVTVVRAELVDDGYGNQVPDWANAARHVVLGCRVQPERGSEYTLDRDAIVTRWRLFAPAAADIRDTDRIEYEGVTYDIDGSVERWPSPTGRLAHIEARLVRTEG
jgi:Phage head-tail joining protein.